MTDSPPAPKSDRAGRTGTFTPGERRELLRDAASGGSGGGSGPVCPRCGTPCAVIRTGPRADVSYVRDRVIVRCPACRRSVAAEAGELES